MAAILYSLSRIWPLGTTEIGIDVNPSPKHSEADLKEHHEQTLKSTPSSSADLKQSSSKLSQSAAGTANQNHINPINGSTADGDQSNKVQLAPSIPSSSACSTTTSSSATLKNVNRGRKEQEKGSGETPNGPKRSSADLIGVTVIKNPTYRHKSPARFPASLEPASIPLGNTNLILARMENYGNRNISNAGFAYQVPPFSDQEQGQHSEDGNYHHHQRQRYYQESKMWEDSGYESPMLRTQVYPNVKDIDSQQPAATVLSISQTKKPPMYSADEFYGNHSGPSVPATKQQQYQGSGRHSASVSVPTTPVLTRPKPFARSTTSVYVADQQGGQGQSHDSGHRELGPAYTSTPIKKSSTDHRYGGSSPAYATYQQHSNNSSASLASQKFDSVNSVASGRRSSCARLEGSAADSKKTEDYNSNQILQENSEVYHAKYSNWIGQMFQLEAEKIQRHLHAEFAEELDLVRREKDNEILQMQQQFRDKLTDYESSTEKFQAWIQSLTEENDRIRATKDTMINEMEKNVAEQRANVKRELEAQINNVQAEFEKEKLELQKKHADQLASLNDKLTAQLTQRKEYFQSQLESVKNENAFLQQEKDALQTKLDSCRKSEIGRNGIQKVYTKFLKEREEMMLKVNGLTEGLSMSEKEKDELISKHNAALNNAQHQSDEAVQALTSQLAEAQKTTQELVRKYKNENYGLQKTLHEQDAYYKYVIEELKGKYGSRIDNLTFTVEDLQRQLFGQESQE